MMKPTIAETQAKYHGIHTPDEIATFEKNMENSSKCSLWDSFIHMNRIKGPVITAAKYAKYCEKTLDKNGDKRDPVKPVMFRAAKDLEPYWMALEYSSVNNSVSWQKMVDPPFTADEGEGDDWY